MNHKQLLDQWAKERKEIYDLSESGMSYRDIAKRYGVSDTAILLRINRYKKTLKPKEKKNEIFIGKSREGYSLYYNYKNVSQA